MISVGEVRDMMTNSLFTIDELDSKGAPKGSVIEVEGLVNKFGFHPGRLAEQKERLEKIIEELDPKFLADGGAGFTFLNLAFDKEGRQWGEQMNAEALFCLCAGLGMAKYCLPRDMWDVLPGGVPYVVFSKAGFT